MVKQTVTDIINHAVKDFTATQLHCGHGFTNFADEVLALVLYALNKDYSVDDTFLKYQPNAQEYQQIAALLKRRMEEHTPTAYLTHTMYFAGLAFYVDERAIIPRSPIAELIVKKFSPWKNAQAVHCILDLCTGGGCIAIACAQMFPQAQVHASDISKEALAVAQINCERHNKQNQVHLWQSDLFAALPSDLLFDIIVSNPPYIDPQEASELPIEYSREPQLSLYAKETGLAIVKRILHQAKNYLAPGGILVLEVGAQQEKLIHQYPDVAFTWLEFELGGEGVLLLTTDQLNALSESTENGR